MPNRLSVYDCGAPPASFWASELDPNNFGWRVVNGSCVGRPFRFGNRGHKSCFGFEAAMGQSSAAFELRNWTVKVHGMRSCTDRGQVCLVSGPAHRLDIGFYARGDAPSRDSPHGIIGQSYATPGTVRHGKTDSYPWTGHYTTSAQAEGAIDGTATDYEMASAYATEFAFSRFNAARREPVSTGGNANDVVDASSIDRVADLATEVERRRLSEAPCPPPAPSSTPPPPPPSSPPWCLTGEFEFRIIKRANGDVDVTSAGQLNNPPFNGAVVRDDTIYLVPQNFPGVAALDTSSLPEQVEDLNVADFPCYPHVTCANNQNPNFGSCWNGQGDRWRGCTADSGKAPNLFMGGAVVQSTIYLAPYRANTLLDQYPFGGDSEGNIVCSSMHGCTTRADRGTGHPVMGMLTDGEGGGLTFSSLDLTDVRCPERYSGNYYHWACFRGGVAWGDKYVVLVPWASKQLVVLEHREGEAPNVIVQEIAIVPDEISTLIGYDRPNKDTCESAAGDGRPCVHVPWRVFDNNPSVRQDAVGWFGGGVAVGNSVYLAPNAVSDVGVINFESGAPVFSTISLNPAPWPYHDLARLGYTGAASFEGKVFFAPATLETPIGMLDTDTNTFSRIPLPPSIKSRSSEGILYLFSGATAVGPWIFFAPARADHVGVLHAETLNFTTIDMATPTATDGIDWNSVRNDRDVFSGAVTVGDRPFFVPYYGDGAEGANLRYVGGGIGTIGCIE